jgi:hypothetical protein
LAFIAALPILANPYRSLPTVLLSGLLSSVACFAPPRTSHCSRWEIIGWYPDRQQIRSWIFDSNGGFGESTWANDGEHWLIQASNVLPDGSHSTAEHVLTRVDDNKFTWESQNRTLNGELQPSLDKIEVQRLSQN